MSAEETPKEETKECYKCKKEKNAAEGYSKLGGMFFCCKECCEKDAKKEDHENNVCEFC